MTPPHPTGGLGYEFLPTSPLGPALSVTFLATGISSDPLSAPFSRLPSVVAVGLSGEKKKT